MLKGCSQATRDKFRDRIMRDVRVADWLGMGWMWWWCVGGGKKLPLCSSPALACPAPCTSDAPVSSLDGLHGVTLCHRVTRIPLPPAPLLPVLLAAATATATACLQLLKHLTVQRPVNANRSDYYVHAEAFAALVAIEIVPPEVRLGCNPGGGCWGKAQRCGRISAGTHACAWLYSTCLPACLSSPAGCASLPGGCRARYRR